MSNQLQITGGAKVRNLDGVITGTTGVLNSLPINASNGIPQLDSNGKILVSQLPNSVMEYQGTWNVATNTPYLVNGVGNAGDVYLVTGAATGGTNHNFGAGNILFYNGDQTIYDGSAWQRASGSTGTVTSVAVTESSAALNITGSPITTSGTINIGFAGTSAQYVAGDGSLITFPSLSGYVPYTGATNDLNLGIHNYYGNNYFDGFTSVAASTTPIVLTINSTPSYLVTGSGGQTIKLPDATTLPNGAVYSFNNNQTTGAISVNNNSNTLVKSVPSGAYLTLVLTDNTSAAGSWDAHFQAPSNVSWSTNTFDYAGSFTSGTWNGNVIAINRGGTGASTAAGALTNLGAVPTTRLISTTSPLQGGGDLSADRTLSITQAGTSTNGYLSSTDWNTFNSKQSALTFNSPLVNTAGVISISAATNLVSGYLTSTDWTTFNNKQSALSGTGFVKISGTTISYDNSAYYLASNPNSYIALTALSAGSGISYNNTTGVISSTITQYTDAMARAAISLTTTGTSGAATYNSTTGVLNIPNYNSMVYPSAGIAVSTGTAWGTSITDNSSNWNTAYSLRITSATSPLSIVSNVISISQATTSTNGYLSSTDWNTFNNKQAILSLTTTGSSGSSTLVGSTLNVPTYTLSGLGGVPTSRTLTINGTAYDLSTDRSWSVGTVISVAALTLGTTGTDLSSSVATGTTTPVITLNVPTASASNRGALSSADWSTFNGKESVLTFSSPLVRTTNTISIPVATTSVNGYLSSTDWTTFNNKQGAITLTTIGTIGAATLVGSTLNIPQYSGGGMAIGGSITSATAGSILYAGASGVLAQDNSNFYYDYTNARLALGTTTVGSKLQVNGNAAIGYSASTAAPTNGLAVNGSANIGGAGNPTLNIIGTDVAYTSILNINAAGSGSSKIFAVGGTNPYLQIGVGTNSYLSINNSGNVSLGTNLAFNATSSKLQVNGNVAIGYSASTAAPTNGLAVAGSAFLGGLQVGGLTFNANTSATTSTMFYYFNGTTATLTFPSTSGISSYFVVKNGGTGILTIATTGSDKLMALNTTTQTTTLSIAAGSQASFISNGAFIWVQIN